MTFGQFYLYTVVPCIMTNIVAVLYMSKDSKYLTEDTKVQLFFSVLFAPVVTLIISLSVFVWYISELKIKNPFTKEK